MLVVLRILVRAGNVFSLLSRKEKLIHKIQFQKQELNYIQVVFEVGGRRDDDGQNAYDLEGSSQIESVAEDLLIPFLLWKYQVLLTTDLFVGCRGLHACKSRVVIKLYNIAVYESNGGRGAEHSIWCSARTRSVLAAAGVAVVVDVAVAANCSHRVVPLPAMLLYFTPFYYTFFNSTIFSQFVLYFTTRYFDSLSFLCRQQRS